ncbi:MAG: hypothetical protein MJ050_06620 [Phascolarctobacterium sp.]|nr:hypothetical protein [Phascolarctobacterium sp.]
MIIKILKQLIVFSLLGLSVFPIMYMFFVLTYVINIFVNIGFLNGNALMFMGLFIYQLILRSIIGKFYYKERWVSYVVILCTTLFFTELFFGKFEITPKDSFYMTNVFIYIIYSIILGVNIWSLKMNINYNKEEINKS